MNSRHVFSCEQGDVILRRTRSRSRRFSEVFGSRLGAWLFLLFLHCTCSNKERNKFHGNCLFLEMQWIFEDEQTFYFAFFTFTVATILAAVIASRFIKLNPSHHWWRRNARRRRVLQIKAKAVNRITKRYLQLSSASSPGQASAFYYRSVPAMEAIRPRKLQREGITEAIQTTGRGVITTFSVISGARATVIFCAFVKWFYKLDVVWRKTKWTGFIETEGHYAIVMAHCGEVLPTADFLHMTYSCLVSVGE